MDESETNAALFEKAERMYDENRPGFVHAQREPHDHMGWTRLRFPSGLECVTNSSPIESELLYNEVFVSKDYVDDLVSISPGDVIVDVGANIGLFAAYLLLNLSPVRMHVIEPVPETFEVLRENLSRFGAGNITFHNMALGAVDDSTLDLTVFPLMYGNSTAYPKTKEPQRNAISTVFSRDELERIYTSRQITVPATTLSALIREADIETIDFLKIDTEGAEIDILQGIEARDWLRIRQVALEVHDEQRTLPRVTSLLRSKGYSTRIREHTRESIGTVVILATRE